MISNALPSDAGNAILVPADFQSKVGVDPSVLLAEETILRSDLVTRYFDSEEGRLNAGDPPLSRKDKSARKGLPTRENLEKLASAWLVHNHKLWPALAQAGVIPPNNDQTVRRLAVEFQNRFLAVTVQPFVAGPERMPWKAPASIYLRYSCDNSNPRSLDDQLGKALFRAHQDGRYVPWEYVFADASVSGRTHLRRGYRLAKEAIGKCKDNGIDTLYIDDFGRATRDALESYRLAKMIERLRMRLIGVSDNFDLSNPQAQVQLMATAMYNEMFVRQLREKVMRGMKGAAARGTSVGKVRIGYRLVPMKDKAGNTVMNEGKGKPVMIAEIDPDYMLHVIEAATLFGEQFKSYKWIARQFNARKVGGNDHWTGSQIRSMLACPLYIGVAIYNRTCTLFDSETGEFRVESNPRKDWIITVVPHLRGWPDELWKKVRRRAAYVRLHAPNTGRTYRAREISPAALLLGILYCEDCGAEMNLIRSTEKYKQYGCPNGTKHVGKCRMTSSKSSKICEDTVVRWLMEKALTRERMMELVTKANAFLTEEASRPKLPTAPLRATLSEAVAQEKKLMAFVLKHETDHDMSSYLKKGDELRKFIAEQQAELIKLEAVNAAPPPPLDLEQVMGHLQDLRGLLNQSVEKSCSMIRALTGKILVSEVAQPPKKRKLWIAKIRGDLVKFFAAAATDSGYPSRATWEYLYSRGWTMRVNGTISLENVPKYEKLAKSEAFVKAVASGKIPYVLSNTSGLSYKLAADATRFLKTGLRPKWSPQKPKKKTPRD